MSGTRQEANAPATADMYDSWEAELKELHCNIFPRMCAATIRGIGKQPRHDVDSMSLLDTLEMEESDQKGEMLSTWILLHVRDGAPAQLLTELLNLELLQVVRRATMSRVASWMRFS